MFDRLDPWLVAAADCLELFPDEMIVATGEQLLQVHDAEVDEKLGAYKKLLFDTITKYYNSQERVPLLAGRHMNIHTGILKLLGKIDVSYISTIKHFFAHLRGFKM